MSEWRKTGQMAFRTKADLQNQAIGWLRKGYSSLGGGTVVSSLQTWRPSGECRFKVQNRRKPLRCQPITVVGFTIARASRQSGQKVEIRTQNQRSDGYSRGRGVFRFSTASCWRIARLSKYEAANARSSRCRRTTTSRMSIFRMAERLSGRWLDSQGFCGVRGFDEPHLLVRVPVAVFLQ